MQRSADETNTMLLNNLAELHIEIRELRKTTAEQFRYLNDNIGKVNNECLLQNKELENNFVRSSTFWKVHGIMFTLTVGCYSFCLYVFNYFKQ